MSDTTDSKPPEAPPDFLRGSVEPHGPMLNAPSHDQLLYKVMKTEHFLVSLEGRYLHFNRVDSYRDFPGADARDGEQLAADRPGNASTKFEKAPEFTAKDYYDRSRGRTYASCFSLENSEHIWREYGNGGTAGKICLVFNFGRLRETLNAAIESQEAAMMYGTCAVPRYSRLITGSLSMSIGKSTGPMRSISPIRLRIPT